MIRDEVLGRYDAEMRRNPVSGASVRYERRGRISLAVGRDTTIVFADLRGVDVRAVVAEQVAFFQSAREKVEWKVYGHDFPPDLGTILGAAGFVPDPPETLVAFDLADGLPQPSRLPGIEVRRVSDVGELQDAVAVSSEVFGQDEGWLAVEYGNRLEDPTIGLFVAYQDGGPVSTGRLEMPPQCSFASLWGGGTLLGFRHQGVYRALVAARAETARRAGYRYLTAEARETSRPILERLGFLSLTGITGWVFDPSTSRDPG